MTKKTHLRIPGSLQEYDKVLKDFEEEEKAKELKTVFTHILKNLNKPKATILMEELFMLVGFAIKHKEITLSRAQELLGVNNKTIRMMADQWSEND
jgi:DNA-binding protein Fis